MSVLVEFSINPVGKSESISEYVSRCVAIVEAYGVPFRLNPMGTVIEGDWDQCFEVLRACYDNLRGDCPRLEFDIKVDARAGGGARLEENIESVEKKVGHVLHH